MSDGGASTVRLAAAEEEDPLHPHISIRLFSSSSSSSLTVCVPAAWLSRVPYFATQLTEPWIHSSPQQQIALECTPGSSPQAYLQCLHLLRSSPTSWPPLLVSVSEVLQILPVADHLLFQECWDACMGFLACSPWSIDEEDAIRATISKLNMEPSPDVKERLDTSHDGAILEALLLNILLTPSCEESFGTWCQKCLKHSSAPFAEAFHSILLKVMESLSASIGKNSLHRLSIPRAWYVLAKFLLQFTDAQQFILRLANSEVLLEALASYSDRGDKDSWHIFNGVLEKVEKRVVLLSNLQRARLVKWSKYGPVKEGSSRQRIAETLPFGDAIRMDVMKSKSEVLLGWIDQVSHRVSRMDEAGLKAVLDHFETKKS